MGFARGADVAAVEQEPMMGVGDVGLGDVLHQLQLYLQRRVG